MWRQPLVGLMRRRSVDLLIGCCRCAADSNHVTQERRTNPATAVITVMHHWVIGRCTVTRWCQRWSAVPDPAVAVTDKGPEAGHRVEGKVIVSRRSRSAVDPEALERIRASRAAEDAAIASLFRQAALVEAAKQRRAEALVALDAKVVDAEDSLADERAALVAVAGLQRAATVLAVTPAALRKLLPHDATRSRSARPDHAQPR